MKGELGPSSVSMRWRKASVRVFSHRQQDDVQDIGKLPDQIHVAQTALKARKPLRGLILIKRIGVAGQPLMSRMEKGSFRCRRRFIWWRRTQDDPPSIDSGVGDPNRLVMSPSKWPRRTASVPRDVIRWLEASVLTKSSPRPRATAAGGPPRWGFSETSPHARHTNALPSRSYSVPKMMHRRSYAWGHGSSPSGSIVNSGGIPT